jgi:hypothetical protein
MSSSVADFPEFTACPLAKGTWWASGKEAEKYAAGHNMLLVVKEGRLLYAADRSRGSMNELKEVRFVQRVSGEIQIKTLSLTSYNLRKTYSLASRMMAVRAACPPSPTSSLSAAGRGAAG